MDLLMGSDGDHGGGNVLQSHTFWGNGNLGGFQPCLRSPEGMWRTCKRNMVEFTWIHGILWFDDIHVAFSPAYWRLVEWWILLDVDRQRGIPMENSHSLWLIMPTSKASQCWFTNCIDKLDDDTRERKTGYGFGWIYQRRYHVWVIYMSPWLFVAKVRLAGHGWFHRAANYSRQST